MSRWRCPFPLEADGTDIDHAVITLRVEVDASGAVTHARALDDPGHGFARQARLCALCKRWNPGRTRSGQPTQGVAIVRVTFER